MKETYQVPEPITTRAEDRINSQQIFVPVRANFATAILPSVPGIQDCPSTIRTQFPSQSLVTAATLFMCYYGDTVHFEVEVGPLQGFTL